MTTNIETISNRAFTIHQEVKQLCRNVQENFLQLGERLFWIENDKLYLELGFDDFESYLGDPDITIGRTMAFMSKEVFRAWIYQLEYSSSTVELFDAGVSKLYIARDVALDGNSKEWLSDAVSLSRSDLKKKVKKAGGENEDDQKRPYTWSDRLRSSQLPMWTEDRAYNSVHNIIDSSYPEAPPRDKDGLTRAIVDEFRNMVYPAVESGMPKSFWKKLARMYRGWFEGWRNRALRAEQAFDSLRLENRIQFEEILALQEELNKTPDYAPKEDWAAGVLLE